MARTARREASGEKRGKKTAKIKAGQQVPAEVQELFEKHEKYLKAGKANYARADKALAELLQRCEPGVMITLPAAGKKPPIELTIVDQFADRNTVWAGAACKRFKIDSKEIKPQNR